jgi:predicted NAD-dependent protein-ADP-ribosyltransferase YbiA (DUF1768 family)
MDIGSGKGFPASSLSNFSPHPFILDGVKCNSMEGFLQSLKFQNPEMQKEVCKMVGLQAKFKGKKKKWWVTQTLFWQDVEINRHSVEYQTLLDRAFDALSKNTSFRSALLASGDSSLTHSIGKNDPSHTVLTQKEFCVRLTQIRERLKKEG